MARRLFEPERDAQITNASVGFTPAEEQQEPPRLAALDEEVARAKAEKDPATRLMTMAQLLHDRQDEFRQRWGEDEFRRVAGSLRQKIAKTPLQTGQAGPGVVEQGLQNVADINNLPADVLDYATTPLAQGETIGSMQGHPIDLAFAPARAALGVPEAGESAIGSQEKASAVLPRLFKAAVQQPLGNPVGQAILGGQFASSIGNAIGAGVADSLIGPSGGPSIGESIRGLTQPMTTFAENTTALPALGAAALGYDPNSLPSIMARSDEYLTNLALRNENNPLEGVFGGAMVGGVPGVGRQVMRAAAASRRVFNRPAPLAAPVTAQTPQPARMVPSIEESEVPAPYVPDRSVPEYTMPTQPIDQVIPKREPSIAERPKPANMEQALADRQAVRFGDVFSEEPVQATRPAEQAPTPSAPSTAEQAADEAAAKLESQPGAISFQDVDRMIEQASRQTTITERQIAPGKKRISMAGGGSGRVRVLGRGRSRSGALVVPNAATIKQAFTDLGDAISNTGRKLLTKAQGPGPQPAPAPGSTGGPGSGVPFTVQSLNVQLRPAATRGLLHTAVDLTVNPASADSWFQKTGINEMGIQATRIGNVLKEQVNRFLFGDESGMQWLEEQFQKAGPELWSAVSKTREGATLTPGEQAAIQKHSQIFHQLTGPAFRFLDHVRNLNIYRDLGANYWPYQWGSIGDVNALAGEGKKSPFREWYDSESSTAPDRQRTTWDTPLRNPVTVMREYASSLQDKLVRGQMIEKARVLWPQLDAHGKMLLDGYVKGVLFKQPDALSRFVREWRLGDALKEQFKPGDSFPLDGAWGLDGRLTVGDEAYKSEARGQTYNVKIDGRDWPVAFSGPELAALKMGELPSGKLVSEVVGKLNGFAALRSIAGNARSFWRQLTGGQGRFLAETALGDYSHGHGKGLDYWRGKLSAAEQAMLKDSGILEHESSIDGLDQRASTLKKWLFSNVYVPDTQTKVAAFFAEINRLEREQPGLSREQKMDRATDFALRVSDAQLELVQAPYGAHPVYSLLGLFNKSRLRQLRHMANLDAKGAVKFAAGMGTVMAGMKVLGNLDSKEMRSILWGELPLGESLGAIFGDPARNPSVVGAAGLDVAIAYGVSLLRALTAFGGDLAKGRSMGSGNNWWDELDRRMRMMVPMSGMYRTASDAGRLLFGGHKASEAARKSLFTSPSKPYQTNYQRRLLKEKRPHRASMGSW